MNQRNQVMLALQNLEQQFLMQQQQIHKHTRYLSAWYAENRLKLGVWMVTISIGAAYLVQKLEKRPQFSKPWMRRARVGLLWALDFFALNPPMVRSLVTHFLSETRRLKTL